MEASEPKSVNPVLKTIGVNSLKLGGLQMNYQHFPYTLLDLHIKRICPFFYIHSRPTILALNIVRFISNIE